MTIDTTAANLVPSNNVASFRGQRSSEHYTRQRHQLWRGDFLSGGVPHYEFNNGRNQSLRMAIARDRKLMTVLPIASNGDTSTRSERQVCNEFKDGTVTVTLLVTGRFVYIFSVINGSKSMY